MNNKKKVHLIGIAGSGMSALAVLFKEFGWQVSGTDATTFLFFADYLKKNKIHFCKKYSKKNIPPDADLVVVGNSASLAKETNPETKHAVESGFQINSLPEALASLSKAKENILVVGSSGKSTVASLLAWCLREAGKDSSYFIGALPVNFRNSSHIGKGKEFIIEGDEYTSSKTDKRSKFLHFEPSAVLFTSASHDHVNVFPTEKLYRETYKKLMRKIKKKGLLVYSLHATGTKEISKEAECRTVSYGLEMINNKETRARITLAQLRKGNPCADCADWYAENVKYGTQSSFDLMHRGKKIIGIKTLLLGKHNIENIVGVGALLLESKKITPKVFAEAIKTFHGVRNRIELKNKSKIVPVYQGFGSSYEKAKAIFETLQLHFPQKRIITVFEPYSFCWRNRKFLKWYKNIFDDVDEVIMLPATGHGKKAKDQLTTGEVWREAKKYAKIRTVRSEKETLQILRQIVKKNDVIALVSSGPMFGLTESVPKLINRKLAK